jgi:gliding motility-associated-like protein
LFPHWLFALSLLLARKFPFQIKMRMKKLILFFSLLLISGLMPGQGNNTCANAQPFCTGQVMNFPAGVNAGNAQPGPNYGCLFSQPNPAWFYMQILTGGPLIITMGAPQDIDFICWGPFPSLAGACNSLTAGNTVDCSYSANNTETCTIANAIPGQFYLLLITNYSNANQNITFQQINAGQPGAATTNCGILCSMTVTGTSSLCSGNSATLAAVGGTQIVNINWLGPGGYSSNNNPNPTVPNLTASGVYTALATTTGTNPNTNTCSVTQSITVIPNPTPVVSNNGPLCEGATASFNCSGGSTYTWSGPGGFTSNSTNPTIPNAASQHNGVYTVVMTSSNCSASGSTTLQVKPNPTVTAQNTGSYCVGQSFNLMAGGAASYTWTGPGGYLSYLQNNTLPNNNLNYSGTYNLMGSTNGCTSTAFTTVQINPLPNVGVSSNGPVCSKTQLILNATGAVSYVWNGPGGYNSTLATINVPQAPVSMNGNYTVTGTDANGCTNTATLSQIVYDLPSPVIFNSHACINDNLNLQVSGGISYFWTGPGGYTSTAQSPIIPNANMANQGQYTVVLTGVGGCTSAAVADAVIFGRPVISYSGTTEVCSGEKFQFNGQGGVTYNWVIPWGMISNNSTFSISSLSPDLQTTYTLVGFDVNGCSNTVVINPVVLALPMGRVFPEVDAQCVPFTAGFTLNKASQNITGVTWSLDNGMLVNDSLHLTEQITTPGPHWVKVQMTDYKGCTNTVTNTVLGYPKPVADFNFSTDTPTELENKVTFYDNSSGAKISQYYWDFESNGQHTSKAYNPTYAFTTTGYYFTMLKVTSDHGCVDSVFKKLLVDEDVTFYIPNSFTPNNDGLNDIFTPKGVGIKKYHMDIYDRWGELIYSTSDIMQGWDGRHRKGGNILPEAVYVYQISVVQKEGGKVKNFTGHVSLIK